MQQNHIKRRYYKKESSYDSDFYDLWMACVDTNLPPNGPANGWIKLDNEWDSCSSYINGDIVYCKKEGLNSFIVAIKDIFEDTVPYHDVFIQRILEYGTVLVRRLTHEKFTNR